MARAGRYEIAKIKPRKTEGSSGYVTYSGDYLNREIADALKTDIKRWGSYNAYGQADLMRNTDATISAAYEMMIEPIINGDPQIEGLNEGVPQDVVDFVADCLFNQMEVPFDWLVREALNEAPWYGHGVFEEEWAMKDGAIRPIRLHARLPWTIWGWLTTDGTLHGIVQYVQRSDADPRQLSNLEVTIPADKLTVWVHNQRGDDFRGRGMYRDLHPLWRTKQQLMKYRLIGHDRNASGVPYFEPMNPDVPAMTADDEERAQEFLEGTRAHSGSWVRSPLGYVPRWFINEHWAGQAAEIRKDIEQINGEVLMRMQQTAMGLGIIGQGSRAVGDVQDNARLQKTDALSREFCATLNGTASGPAHTGLIRRIVDRNFEGYAESGNPYPYLRIGGLKFRKVEEFFAAVQAMKASGMPVAKAAVDVAHNLLGIDPPTEEEIAEAEERKNAMADAMRGKPPESEENEPTTKREEDPEEVEAAYELSYGFKPSRPLTPLEGHLALSEINARLDVGVVEWQSAIRRVLVEHAGAIAEAGAQGRAEMRAAIDSMMPDVRRVAHGMATDTAQAGYTQVSKERSRMKAGKAAEVAKVQQDLVKDRRAAVEMAATPGDGRDPVAQQNLDDVAESAAEEIEAAVRAAAARARAQRVAGELMTEAIAEAILGIPDSTIRQPGFGLTSNAFNIGREEFAKEFASEVRTVQVSEIMDQNTCDECAAHDGMTFPMNSPEMAQHQTPYAQCAGGMKCRGMLVFDFSEV